MFRFANTTVVVPNSQLMPPPGKKVLEKEPIIMVPVHADDFKKLNEFAESAWVMREVTADPRNADRIKENIKETRRKLLSQVNNILLTFFLLTSNFQHNDKLLKTLDKKKKQ